MYNVLLLTHGSLAEKFKDTLGMFISNKDYVYAVGLKESGIQKFTDEVCNTIENIYSEENGVLILADLYGGTPFNVAVKEIKSKYNNVEIIAGLNLPMLVEACLMRDNDLKTASDIIMGNKENYISRFEMCTVNEDDE